MSEYTYEFHTVPLADTGIGQSLGFESDAAFLEHQKAERAKLDPDVQEALEEYQRAFLRTMLFGAP